jgi:hypothetical protein
VAIPHAQQRHRAEVRAGGLPTDQQAVAAEFAVRLLDQPRRRRLAVVGARRIPVLRRQAVADLDHGDAELLSDEVEEGVLLVGRPQCPASPVEVEVHATAPLLTLPSVPRRRETLGCHHGGVSKGGEAWDELERGSSRV